MIMRSCGCVINDLIDVKYDRLVERTSKRPLADNKLSTIEAKCFVVLHLCIGFIVIGICSLPIVFAYPFMKRITYFPQVVLGLAFNYGALMGYTALTSKFNLGATLSLYIGGIMWTLIYDTIYAHQDKVDDLKVGVKSLALLLHNNSKKYFSLFATLSVSSFCLAGYFINCSSVYYALIVGLCSGHYYWQIKTLNINNTKDCWNKFNANNVLGLFVAVSILLDMWICDFKQKEHKKKTTEPN